MNYHASFLRRGSRKYTTVTQKTCLYATVMDVDCAYARADENKLRRVCPLFWCSSTCGVRTNAVQSCLPRPSHSQHTNACTYTHAHRCVQPNFLAVIPARYSFATKRNSSGAVFFNRNRMPQFFLVYGAHLWPKQSLPWLAWHFVQYIYHASL